MTRTRGFTLIEMAVTLFIITLVIGAMMGPLRAHIENRNDREANDVIAQYQDAIMAFVGANGRLPCPVATPPAGTVLPANPVENCALTDGLVPYHILGLQAIDPWGRAYRYAVDPNYVTLAGIKAIWQTPTPPGLPGRAVCTTAAGASATACAAGATTATAAAVIYSQGAGQWGTADEGANLDGDAVFVQRARTDPGMANPFDDIVVPISTYLLLGRLITTTQLP